MQVVIALVTETRSLLGAASKEPRGLKALLVAVAWGVLVGLGVWTFRDPSRWTTLMLGSISLSRVSGRALSILWIALPLGFVVQWLWAS